MPEPTPKIITGPVPDGYTELPGTSGWQRRHIAEAIQEALT